MWHRVIWLLLLHVLIGHWISPVHSHDNVSPMGCFYTPRNVYLGTEFAFPDPLNFFEPRERGDIVLADNRSKVVSLDSKHSTYHTSPLSQFAELEWCLHTFHVYVELALTLPDRKVSNLHVPPQTWRPLITELPHFFVSFDAHLYVTYKHPSIC